MSDLISRSALLKEFEEMNAKGTSDLWHITGIKALIENQPTAYDVEQVVKELEERRKKLIEEEQIRAYAEIYAKNLILYGVNVGEKLETATQMSYALNQAYMRGRQDATDIYVGGKWIPIGQYPAEPSLLCFKSGNMTVGYYDYEYEGWSVLTADGFETDMTDEDMEDGEPIAYRSLPEPYKEE